MNEITTVIQLLQHIPFLYLGIGGLFILLLITKNNFTQPPNIPQKSHASFFAIYIFLFAVIPTVYFGWGFYQAYYPNYKYDEVSGQLNFHIYRPSYLPINVQQGSAYSIKDQPLFPDSSTVSVTYATTLNAPKTLQNDQFIIMLQSKTPADFALLPYIEQRDETSAPLIETPTAITITSFPGAMAYLVQQEFINQVWLVTKDNVLIVLTSPIKSTTSEELIKIAESLH